MRNLFAALLLNPVVRGSLQYTSASIASRLLGFALLPVWTKLLSPAQFGTVAVALSCASIAGPVLSLGLPSAVFRYWQEIENEAERRLYFSSITWFSLLFVSICVSIFAGAYFLFIDPNNSNGLIATLTTLITISTIFNNLASMPIRAVEKHGLKATIDTCKTTSENILGLAIVGYFNAGSAGKLVGTLLGTIIGLVSSLWSYSWTHFGLCFKWSHVKESLAYGLPLIPHVIGGIIIVSSDRIMLGYMSDSTSTGLYSFGANLSGILAATFVSINMAWQPRCYRFIRDKRKKEIKAYAYFWLAGAGVLTVALSIFLPWVVLFLADAKYQNSMTIIPFILCAAFMNGIYFIGSTTLFYFKRGRQISKLTGIAAAINILANLILIPTFGMYGAAVSSVIAMTFLAVSSFHYSKKEFEVDYSTILIISGVLWLLISTSILAAIPLAENILLTLLILSTTILFALWLMFRATKVLGRLVPSK